MNVWPHVNLLMCLFVVLVVLVVLVVSYLVLVVVAALLLLLLLLQNLAASPLASPLILKASGQTLRRQPAPMPRQAWPWQQSLHCLR